MKLTFTCCLGFFFLFICVCVFIIQSLPQKSENQHFTTRLKQKNPVVMEEIYVKMMLVWLTVMLALPSLQKACLT